MGLVIDGFRALSVSLNYFCSQACQETCQTYSQTRHMRLPKWVKSWTLCIGNETGHKTHPSLIWTLAGGHHHVNETWNGISWTGKTWTSVGANVDQGVLYQWIKFEMRNWSHLTGKYHDVIEDWREVTLEQIRDNKTGSSFTNVVEVSKNGAYIAIVNKTIWKPEPCLTVRGRGPTSSLHLNGAGKKPWQKPIKAENIPDYFNASSMYPRDIWLYCLGVANRTWNLDLPSKIKRVASTNPLQIEKTYDRRSELLQPDVEIPQ